MNTGKVYLVGAGPGDPGLITCKGIECLASADVIIYDHLLDEVLLKNARPEAEIIYAGKTASVHSMEQTAINRLLVKKASEGKTVVRLKGGDPFVFGRGGEEAEVLARNSITFEIVPGVSSAIAVPAYAGIPVTHRAVASSVAIITGHEDPTKPFNSIDWGKISTGIDTLVFLMGMNNLPYIVSKLIENGRHPKTPVAVIRDGTSPQQITISGNLMNIIGKVKKQKLSPPTVIVVGKVVNLHKKLRWFDNRKLWGKRVLVTRARQQASKLSDLLLKKGAQPVELPAINIRPVKDNGKIDAAICNLESYHWVIFTSVNGVEAFFDRLHDLNFDSRVLYKKNIGAIGPATAAALTANGIKADFCPDVYTGKGLVNGLKQLRIKGKRFLLPRANIADRELADGISALGGIVHEVDVYLTVADHDAINKSVELIKTGEIDIITFTSSSTVSNLVRALGRNKLPGKIVNACIGPTTAETARKAGLKVDIVAAEHTIPGLVAALEGYFEKEA